MRIRLLLLLSAVELLVFLLGLTNKSILSKTCYLISTAVMSLFLCFSSISVPFLLKLKFTVEISSVLCLTCIGVICDICRSLPMIIFFGKNISCYGLLMIGILRQWFVPDFAKTMTSAVSNHSSSLISSASESIGILLLILPKLTLH